MSIGSRLHLIQQAQHTLDLQYYIWEDDAIGHMLLHALLQAAERGVKVRLMIDDQNGVALDETLKTLAQHRNFEIKIFNPYKYRHFRVADYLLRANQINHRMHNKLIVADGAIAVTGGRNISREYFDASEKFQFTDMDILFLGTAVEDANQLFRQFWDSEFSYDTKQILGTKTEKTLQELEQHYADHVGKKDQYELRIKDAQQQLAVNFKQRPIQWAKAHFIGDLPQKIVGKVDNDQLLYRQFIHFMGQPERNMDLVSAYFVPTQHGTEFLSQLAQNNVKVRVLTNSFQANDVPLVHAYYQKYRKELLQNGVELYEFKPYLERYERTWYEVLTGNIIPAQGKNASSLHAKFFDKDNKVFIGSFNFDPRSAELNTEVGLVVESEPLREEITKQLDHYLPKIAYRLKLNKKGQIEWHEQLPDGSIKIYTHDPDTTKFQRFMMNFVALTPFEWMM